MKCVVSTYVKSFRDLVKKKKFEVKQMINLLQTKRMKKSPKNLQRKNKEAVGKRKWSRLLASAANGLPVAATVTPTLS